MKEVREVKLPLKKVLKIILQKKKEEKTTIEQVLGI